MLRTAQRVLVEQGLRHIRIAFRLDEPIRELSDATIRVARPVEDSGALERRRELLVLLLLLPTLFLALRVLLSPAFRVLTASALMLLAAGCALGLALRLLLGRERCAAVTVMLPAVIPAVLGLARALPMTMITGRPVLRAAAVLWRRASPLERDALWVDARSRLIERLPAATPPATAASTLAAAAALIGGPSAEGRTVRWRGCVARRGSFGSVERWLGFDVRGCGWRFDDPRRWWRNGCTGLRDHDRCIGHLCRRRLCGSVGRRALRTFGRRGRLRWRDLRDSLRGLLRCRRRARTPG
jgi:hypothetical protein